MLERQDLGPKIHLFKIAAPAIDKKAKAGQGEYIPLTLADVKTLAMPFVSLSAQV